MKKKLTKKYLWVQQILDMQRNISSNKKFIENLKLDIFEDRIFVFTPKGDVIDLPVGSNCVDFAYQIHSDVGMLAVSADINGKFHPLTTELKNGDTVSIATSEESDGPQVDWLDSVHTSMARTRIREFLKEKDRTTVVDQAEELLNQKIHILGFNGIEAVTNLQKIMVLEHFEMDAWEDLLYEIGKGTIHVHDLIQVLFTEKELFGEDWAPSSRQAYERMPRRKLKSISPEKVHHINMIVEASNRIGLLRDLCNELANIGINIVMVRSLPRKDENISRIGFVLEIVGFTQYETTILSIRKVDGVFSVSRLQNEEAALLDLSDTRKVHVR